MSRRLKVSSAQLGPINLADSRASVVKRMIEMLKEADSRGSKFVVFPELALTTFFPRYWMEDPNEVEKYFESQMPSPRRCRCSSWRAKRASASTWATPSGPRKRARPTISTRRSWSARTAG